MTEGTETDEPVRPRTVHIDTSLQVEQQKVETLSGPVRLALSQYPFSSTSSYARKEFKKAWLQDLGLLYKLTFECKHIGELYTSARKKTWARTRRLDRILDAANVFFTKYPATPADAAMKRLQSHLREAILGAYVAWDRSVTHEFRGTGCIRATERPMLAMNGTIDVTVRECRRSKIQCTVDRFFESNKAHFEKIVTAIKSSESTASKELLRTASTIGKAMTDPQHLCDSNNCTSMSDAIIAVDGVTTDHFGANNDKEWKLLASALGKTLINPVMGTKTDP